MKIYYNVSHTIIVLLFALMIFSAQTAVEEVCNRENEEYECGSACQTTCSNLDKPCPIVNIKCNEGCYCKEGYARISDDNSTCISISKCPKK